MAGRIATYVHSDITTPNKGGCIVEVATETDFAARTPEIAAFADKVAKLSYGAQSEVWEEVLGIFPDLDIEHVVLEKSLKEKITVRRIVIMRIDEEERQRRIRGRNVVCGGTEENANETTADPSEVGAA